MAKQFRRAEPPGPTRLGVTLQHAAVGKLAERDSLRKVGSVQFLFFCHLSAGISILIPDQDSHRHRSGATKKFRLGFRP